MNYVVGVDIGGTFTDCVVVDEEGRVTIGKSLSTPADFSQGALNCGGRCRQQSRPERRRRAFARDPPVFSRLHHRRQHADHSRGSQNRA